RPEVERIGRSLPPEHVVRGLAEGDLLRRTRPLLVLEAVPVDPDHVVEARDEAAGVRNREEGRALVRHQPLVADEELVALRLAAEDRVVVEDEARLARAALAREEQRGG